MTSSILYFIISHWLKKQLDMFKSRTSVPSVTLDVNIVCNVSCKQVTFYSFYSRQKLSFSIKR